MKKWLYTLLVIVLAACSNEIPEQQPAKRSGRTVLAYLVSNSPNSLEINLQNNVVDMYTALAGSKDSCTLLVFYRPQKYQSFLDVPTLLCFDTDGRGNINGSPALSGGNLTFEGVCQTARMKKYTLNSQVATDPDVMEEVFADMQKEAPSDSYGLIFGSHATGWIKGTSFQARAFGDDNGYNIDIPDLADVLKRSFPEKKLDFVLFDACMMGTAEVGYELKEVTSHCIASVMETPIYGFPYDRILPYLYSENVDYSAVCHEFMSFNKTNNLWGTCAVMDCSQMENLASAVKAKLSEWEDALSSVSMQNVQQYGVNSYKYFSYDVLDFFRELGRKSGIVKTTDLNEAIASVQSALNQAVIAKDCLSGVDYDFDGLVIDGTRFCGIGMYIPKEVNDYVPDNISWNNWNDYYEQSISWYRAAGWADLKLN